MKIHSNVLKTSGIIAALNHAANQGKVAQSVYLDKLEPRGSRKRLSAWDVHLVSTHKEPGSKRRRPNSGQYGYDGEPAWAATYDEWGWFISALFAVDPDAIVGQYGNVEDFDRVTQGRFSTATTTEED